MLKRKIARIGVAAAMLVVFSTTANAVSFTFQNVGGDDGDGLAEVGETWVIDLLMATEADALQAWFLKVDHPGQNAVAASIVPFLFLGAVGTPLGAPVPNGTVGGTEQWAMVVSPPSSFPPGQGPAVYGQITLQFLAPGTVSMDVADAGGAVGGPGGLDLVAAGVVTFDSFEVVPEPTTGLLLGTGLLGLAWHRRRRR